MRQKSTTVDKNDYISRQNYSKLDEDSSAGDRNVKNNPYIASATR